MKDANVVLADGEHEKPMLFPGRWGAIGSVRFATILGGREYTNHDEGGPPASPGLQPLWYETVETIFGSPQWRQADA